LEAVGAVAPPAAAALEENPALRPAGSGTAGERFVWEWRPCVEVHFERLAPAERGCCRSAVVMVHGFGAEGGYYAEQLRAVAGAGAVAYAVDLLGQGRSWPSRDPAPAAEATAWGWGEALEANFQGGLAFGEPTWLEQLDTFIRQVVPEERVYLLGNSVGGYLAAKVAAREPEEERRVSGLILANAAPFWGWFREGLAPWDGRLPVPVWVRPVATLWFSALRANIQSLLSLVYAAPEHGIVSRSLSGLAGRIAEAASHPMGPAAFASILFAPQQAPSFGDALNALAAREVPTLLLYGDDDPWIVRWWAERAAGRISGVGEYYAISPAGHCPHHEAPAAFNRVLVDWLRRADGEAGTPALLSVGGCMEGPTHEDAGGLIASTATTERRL